MQLKIFYTFVTSVRIALFSSLMSIVARGGVVYEFYMEQSSIDFGYILPLKNKRSPQGSGLNFCSCYSKHNCTRPSSDPPSSQGISRGGGDGDNRKDTSYRSYRKHPLLLQSSHMMFQQSTHTHNNLHPTSWRGTSEIILWMTFTCISLITRCQ